jgi:hypothetical protein
MTKIEDFEEWFSRGGRVRLIRNFCLMWSPLVRTRTPSPYELILVIQNRKIRFWTKFGWQIVFLRSF